MPNRGLLASPSQTDHESTKAENTKLNPLVLCGLSRDFSCFRLSGFRDGLGVHNTTRLIAKAGAKPYTLPWPGAIPKMERKKQRIAMAFFSNQVVLITGAGSGLGKQLALRFARDGAPIAAIDINADSLSALETGLPGTRFASALGDVTDREALGKAVNQVRQKLGPIDILVANAGIGIE